MEERIDTKEEGIKSRIESADDLCDFISIIGIGNFCSILEELAKAHDCREEDIFDGLLEDYLSTFH